MEMSGGAHRAMIGEVGLAHNGILFFDELPHFSKNTLEALREPLQDRKIKITRVNSKVEYPADFLFVGAMNPCPCGNLLHQEKECRCSELETQRYKNRLSEPFLERVDIHVEMQNTSMKDTPSYSSNELHLMVLKAQQFSLQRGQHTFNARLSDSNIKTHCIVDREAEEVLNLAVNRFSLSYRSIKSTYKLARTIADLESSTYIQKKHIMEALSYRQRS